MRSDDPTVTAHEPTVHFIHPENGWLGSACGLTDFRESATITDDPVIVTCRSCQRTRSWRAAFRLAQPATPPATQPLSGIPLRPVPCLTCGDPADEVNVSVNVSSLDSIGDYIPGECEYGTTLSDRIGTYCPDCGITLDDSWPLTVLVFVGKQNGELL